MIDNIVLAFLLKCPILRFLEKNSVTSKTIFLLILIRKLLIFIYIEKYSFSNLGYTTIYDQNIP